MLCLLFGNQRTSQAHKAFFFLSITWASLIKTDSSFCRGIIVSKQNNNTCVRFFPLSKTTQPKNKYKITSQIIENWGALLLYYIILFPVSIISITYIYTPCVAIVSAASDKH